MAKEEVTVEEGYKEMDPERAENVKPKVKVSIQRQNRVVRLDLHLQLTMILRSVAWLVQL
jgi:hypothetical protein